MITSFPLVFRFFLGNLFLQILIPAEMKRGLTESYKNMTVEELSTDITDVCVLRFNNKCRYRGQ